MRVATSIRELPRSAQQVRRTRVPILLVVVALLAVTTACGTGSQSASDDVLSTVSNVVTSTATESLAMPADWPAAVPVIGGKLVVSTSAGDASTRAWVVEFLTSPPAESWPVVKRQMEDAGFHAERTEVTADGTHHAVFSNGTPSVRIKAYHEAGTGQDEVAYTVSQLTST